MICGASDTGKSFLAEAVDFMLGGSELKVIPEREGYSAIQLGLSSTEGESWTFERAISGGDFILRRGDITEKLRQSHAHERIDNVSGFLLAKIGLLGKRILKSSAKSKTNSLSFRNLARLVIVQEGEIQQKGSPFWGGQFTLKTAELATIKLLLIRDPISGRRVSRADERRTGRGLLDELLQTSRRQSSTGGRKSRAGSALEARSRPANTGQRRQCAADPRRTEGERRELRRYSAKLTIVSIHP